MHPMYVNGDFSGMELFGLGTLPLYGFLPLLLWALAWKGWALWLAARRGETVWFIVLLVVNTFGILEIIYIFAIAKRNDQPDTTSLETPSTDTTAQKST